MMIKGVSVLVLIVLLLSCPVWSQAIVQNQDFGLENQNGVLLDTVGNGFLSNSQLTDLYNTQVATNATGKVMTTQTQAGTFLQGANAIGEGGLFGVNQLGGALGWQSQLQPNSLQPGQQAQDLDAYLGQDFTKVGGVGMVAGVQAYVGYQLQLILTPYGASANLQTIGVVDAGAVSGGPDSTTVYNGNINSDTSQGANP